MAPLYTLVAFFGLLVLVRGQHLEHFRVATTDSPTTTSTPGVVTNPDSNATSTEAYQSTSFPIWSTSAQTTEHTPNVTSSATTSTATPSTTPTSTVASTTHNPNHTTTEAPTSPVTPTVPVPTLPPEPVAPSAPWNVTYGAKGNYCAMLSFAARIDISYTNVLKQEVQTGLDVPDNATVNVNKSSCEPGHDQEVFVLDFESATSGMGSLAITFRRDASTNDSTIFKVQATVLVTEDLFPGISPAYLGKIVTLWATNLTMFDTEPAHSYLCASLIKTNLTMVQVGDGISGRSRKGAKDKSPFQSGTIETSNLKVQAFMPSDQKIDTFLPDAVCPEDKTDISSTIPITVGVILLFMVVVVLIAYFIGRSRQQKETTTI